MRDPEKYTWHRGNDRDRRAPDLIIGPRDAPQLLRWHLFNRWGIQIALHRWLRSDHDRALHDHTAGNISILLTGRYVEWFFHPSTDPSKTPVSASAYPYGYTARTRWPLIPYYRAGDTAHRVELRWGPLWTLWIRFRPWRTWGFWCPKGWKPWRAYVDERDNGLVGKGCDD